MYAARQLATAQSTHSSEYLNAYLVTVLKAWAVTVAFTLIAIAPCVESCAMPGFLLPLRGVPV